MRLAGTLIVLGLALHATPGVLGIPRSKALLCASTAITLGGIAGLLEALRARRQSVRKSEGSRSA